MVYDKWVPVHIWYKKTTLLGSTAAVRRSLHKQNGLGGLHIIRPLTTIWKFFRTSLFVPIYVLLFTNFGSQIGPFAVLRFFFLFVDQGFFGT